MLTISIETRGDYGFAFVPSKLCLSPEEIKWFSGLGNYVSSYQAVLDAAYNSNYMFGTFTAKLLGVKQHSLIPPVMYVLLKDGVSFPYLFL